MDPNLIGAKMSRETVSKLLHQSERAAIVVDGSPGQSTLALQEDAVALTRGLEARGAKVGVLKFTNQATVERFPEPGSAEPAVRDACTSVPGPSGTGAATAVRAAGALVGPGGLVLVITDGRLGPSARKAVEEMEATGVHVVGVGTSRDDPGQLGSTFSEHYRLERPSALVGAQLPPGQLAELEPFQTKKAVLLVDTSTWRMNHPVETDALRHDVHDLTLAMKRQNGSEVEILSFSDRVSGPCSLDEAFRPSRCQPDGLLALREGASALGGPGSLIFFTDGELENAAQLKAEARKLQSQGIEVVAVGHSSVSAKAMDGAFDLHFRRASREPGYYLAR